MEQKKLRSEQQSEHEQAVQSGQQQVVREFATVEELLRHDAGNVEAPDNLASRLKDSTGKEPPAQPGFWQRLFGR